MQVGDKWKVTIHLMDTITINQSHIDGIINRGLDPDNDMHVKVFFETGIRKVPEKMIGAFMQRESVAGRPTEFPVGSVIITRVV